MMNRSRKNLGIMICETRGPLPFPEKSFFKKLCIMGRKYGITVFVFSPTWVQLDLGTVPGYTYSKSGWECSHFPIPSLIYDRCCYPNAQKYFQVRRAIERFTQTQPVTYLGRGLKGKWDIHQILDTNDEIRQFLPPTQLYINKESLYAWLQANNNEAFLKPSGGSQGKSTLYVQMMADKLRIRGRNKNNEPFERTFRQIELGLHFIHCLIGPRIFIMQPYLQLNSRDEEPFDIRSLVQKDGNGKWHMTGMAVRKGQVGTLTSNLHGGGQAESLIPFLEKEFDKSMADSFVQSMRSLSDQIPDLLEQSHGRLVELGIDFGIDRNGQLWVLEVNSKPGRSVFIRIKDRETAMKSIENPIAYAHYLLLRQLRRVNS